MQQETQLSLAKADRTAYVRSPCPNSSHKEKAICQK